MSHLDIAVIMPLHNKRNYVLEAVESVLAQTRPPDEFVIVDDGSTDGSGELVAERYGMDRGVRLLRQENRGSAAARNAGIRATRSPLLAFLDADDKWLPKRLERQGAFMEQNSSCMLSWVASISYNERRDETTYPPFLQISDKDRFLREKFFPEDIHIGTGSVVMLRREALNQVGLFDESLWKSVDTDMWLRIMLRFGFEYIPERLSWGRRGFPPLERDGGAGLSRQRPILCETSVHVWQGTARADDLAGGILFGAAAARRLVFPAADGAKGHGPTRQGRVHVAVLRSHLDRENRHGICPWGEPV
jgi:glycosyltransferase involved in cell wall biosynthesis